MFTKPMIFPLDPDGVLYCLQDEQGNNIGTGSRETCLILLRLITSSSMTCLPVHLTKQLRKQPPAMRVVKEVSAEHPVRAQERVLSALR